MARIHGIISEKEIVDNLPLFFSPQFYKHDKETRERKLVLLIASIQEQLELKRLGLRRTINKEDQ